MPWRAYASEIEAIKRDVRAGGKMAGTRVGPIECAESGDGQPVLIIHGAGGGYDQGLLVGRAFLGDGFRLIAPSRFGYLATPMPRDPSPAAQADAHAALLDHLAVRRAIVVGVSAGAPSAVELALRHADRVAALILVVPMAYAPGREPALESSLTSRFVLQIVLHGADFAFWALCRWFRSGAVRFLGVPPDVERQASVEDRNQVTTIMRSILPLSWRLRGIQNDAAVRLQEWPLERITAATLIITAADDLFDTLPAARFTADAIHGAKLVVFETGGHFLLGHQAELRTAVTSFLTQAVPGHAVTMRQQPSAPSA